MINIYLRYEMTYDPNLFHLDTQKEFPYETKPIVLNRELIKLST